MKSTKLGLVLALSILPGLAQAYDVPVVGYDKDHNQQVAMVSSKDMAIAIRDVVSKVNDSTLQTLKDQESAHSGVYWMLRDVCVGIGLNFSIGLGPIWSISAAPRVRLGFSNSTHPKIPD